MSNQLVQFYLKLDALDLDDLQACLTFADDFVQLTENFFPTLIFTETELLNLKLIKNDDPNYDNLIKTMNDPDSPFNMEKYNKFLEYKKADIAHIIKLAKLNLKIMTYSEGFKGKLLQTDDAKKIFQYENAISAIYNYTAAIGRQNKQPDANVIVSVLEALKTRLKIEKNTIIIDVLNKSISKLTQSDYLCYLNEANAITSVYEATNIQPTKGQAPLDEYYLLRPEYLIGRELIKKELIHKKFNAEIQLIRNTANQLAPKARMEVETDIIKLKKEFAYEPNAMQTAAILAKAQMIAQSTAFDVEIYKAKKCIKQMGGASSQGLATEKYMMALATSFDTECNFSKRQTILETAKKTNVVLNNPSDKSAINALKNTAKKLIHVSHGQKVIAALGIFISTIMLGAGIVASPTGAGISAAVMGAGLLLASFGLLKNSKSSLKNTVKQITDNPEHQVALGNSR